MAAACGIRPESIASSYNAYVDSARIEKNNLEHLEVVLAEIEERIGVTWAANVKRRAYGDEYSDFPPPTDTQI